MLIAGLMACTGGGGGGAGDGTGGDGDMGDGDGSAGMSGDGDGDVGDGDGDAGDGDGDGDVAPDGTPTAVSTFPADGATGVDAYPSIEIVFSEPMDTASVEASLMAGSLLGFSTGWNQPGTGLTLTLNNLLNHGDDQDAKRYTVSVGADAKDAAGMALWEAFSFTFTTLRKYKLTAPLADPSGMYYWNAMTTSSNIYIGDDVNDDSNRGYFTFDIASIPAEATLMTSTLYSYQEAVAGTPYDVLDNVSGTIKLGIYTQVFSDIGVHAGGSTYVANLCS